MQNTLHFPKKISLVVEQGLYSVSAKKMPSNGTKIGKSCIWGSLAQWEMSYSARLEIRLLVTSLISGFGGLDVACSPLVPKFAGSNPAEAVGFFRAKKFGREVKPFVPCRISAACKRTRKCMRGSRSFRSKLPAISRPSSSSFHY